MGRHREPGAAGHPAWTAGPGADRSCPRQTLWYGPGDREEGRPLLGRVVQQAAGPGHHRGEGAVGDVHRDLAFLGQAHVQSPEQRSAAREEQAGFQDVVGKKMTVKLSVKDGKTRSFDGLVSRFAQVGTSGRYVLYRATLRPSTLVPLRCRPHTNTYL